MIQFIVPGTIRGKARPRVTRNGAYTPQTTKEYEHLIQLAYKCASKGQHFGDKPVKVLIAAAFKIPKRFTKKQKADAEAGILLPTKKPDGDNIAKIVCDALNGVAWDDDAQIVYLSVIRHWAHNGDNEGLLVRIESIEEERRRRSGNE